MCRKSSEKHDKDGKLSGNTVKRRRPVVDFDEARKEIGYEMVVIVFTKLKNWQQKARVPFLSFQRSRQETLI